MFNLSNLQWPLAYGFNASEITLVGLLAILLLVVGARRGSSTRLALRNFELRRAPRDAEIPLVEIVGRSPGLIAFVLTLLQLDALTVFSVTTLGIECRSASLFGQVTKFIPFSSVASIRAGVLKPISSLVVAGLLIVGGVAGSVASRSPVLLPVSVVLAIVFVVHYFLSKSMVLEVSSSAGPGEISLRFSPGVLEGMPIDLGQLMAAAKVIRDLLTLTAAERGREGSPSGVNVSQHVGVGRVESSQMPPPVPASPLPRTGQAPEGKNAEQEAYDALRAAVQLYNQNRRDEAIAALSKIVTWYPSTSSALKAREHLKQVTQ